MVNSLYYKESGKFSPIGVVTTIGGSALVALVLGAIYAYATWYIPIIYLNALLTAALGFGIGLSAGWLAKAGKIRNTWLMMFLGIVAGLLALYFQWVFWVGIQFKDVEGAGLIWSPFTLWEIIKAIGAEGVWGMGDDENTVKGFMLWLIWVIEAAIIVIVAWFSSCIFAGGLFCEGCNEWAAKKEGAVKLALTDQLGGSIQSIEEGYLEPLTTLPRAGHSDPAFARVDLHSCPKCSNFSALDLVGVTLEYDKEGNPQNKETSIISGLLTSSEVLAELRAAWAAPIPAQPVGAGLPPQGSAGIPPQGGTQTDGGVNTSMPNWDNLG